MSRTTKRMGRVFTQEVLMPRDASGPGAALAGESEYTYPWIPPLVTILTLGGLFAFVVGVQEENGNGSFLLGALGVNALAGLVAVLPSWIRRRSIVPSRGGLGIGIAVTGLLWTFLGAQAIVQLQEHSKAPQGTGVGVWILGVFMVLIWGALTWRAKRQ